MQLVAGHATERPQLFVWLPQRPPEHVVDMDWSVHPHMLATPPPPHV
ncbi:MAG: hypothetical protein M3O46_04320 [Myxococcota bacterium]|nr:hypothetical protein [Myxococcota bacterium]